MSVNSKSRTNIFLKYFVISSLIIAVSFTALGTSLMIFATNYWQGEKVALLNDNTHSVAETVRSIFTKDDFSEEYSSTKRMLASTLRVVSNSIGADVFISDKDGNIIVCKERSGVNDIIHFQHCSIHSDIKIDKELITEVGDNDNVAKRRLLDDEKTFYYIVGEPIDINGDTMGYVFATMPINSSNSFVLDILKMFAMSAIVAILMSLLAAYLLTYKMLKPLQQMSKAAKKFAEGDFSYRVKITGNDEITDLAESFNDMAGSLATLESTRRSFVANVSHELKTPMTTISGFIDGILDGTIPPEKQEYYLKIVSDEVKRLSRLVVAMLNMSKIESGDFKIKKSDYDISEQIFRVFLNFEQKINKKNIEILGMDKLSTLVVNADSDMIYQVIYNLVDNAVKFTNEGGSIETIVQRENDKVFIRIRNSGIGIAPEELPKIFERFYKVDRSRSLDVKGAGLGLYIVKSMIELHGGQISVMSKENQYTEFIFWIPYDKKG